MYPISNVVPPPNSQPPIPGLDAYAAKMFGSETPAAAAPPPDPYADDKKLLDLYQKQSRRCDDRRPTFERVWWRLLLYILGRQWIYFESRVGTWVDKRLQKWIPRPVTNKIAETLETILSVFQSVELSVACRPQGGAPKDIMAAETASKYESPIKDDHDWTMVQREHDWWLCALGNAFLFTWWDYSGDSQTAYVKWEQCTVCHTVSSPIAVKKANDCCPNCGCPIMEDAVDKFGQPIQQTVRTGHGRTDVVSPLEVSFPPIFSDPNQSDVMLRRRWRSKEYDEARLPKEMLDKIQWDTLASDRSLQLLRTLAASSDVTGSPNAGGGGGEPSENEGVTECELWMKPTKDYPDGLVLRVVNTTGGGGGMVLRLKDEGLPGPLPFKTVDGRLIWPWLHTGYGKMGGRGLARSPLETLIEKQNQLNQIDSLIQLIVQRCANPVWLEPKGSEVMKFTGEPGLVVKYNPLATGSGTVKPERIEGANVPSSLVQIREMILNDIENLAGTYDIIKGQKPQGVEAFSAMQLLVERSQSRYGIVLESRGATYRRWFKIALEMERQFGPEERAVAILGPNGNWTRQEFQKANLEGSIRIEVEDGSQMPKTALGTRAAIQQLAALNVIDAHNPETAYRILQVFGRTDLYPGLDAQVMGARRVQQAFEEWGGAVQFMPGQPQPIMGPTGAMVVDPATGQPSMMPGQPVPTMEPPTAIEAWQNSAVYLAEHMKWANSDTMQDLMKNKPEIKPFVTMMIVAHQQKLAEEAMAQQAAAGPQKNANGKDGKGVGGGRAMHNSNQESANTNDLQPPPSGAQA